MYFLFMREPIMECATEVDMSVSQAIQTRCSVRSYRNENPDRETVQVLLDAAVRAPTAMHEEPWAFLVIQDRHLLKTISDRAKPLFAEQIRRSGSERSSRSFDHYASPDFNIFYDAGTLIVIWDKPIGLFNEADCWLAAENLILAACAKGLGTCVIGSALEALNLPETKSELGVADDYSAIAPIIVGYPAGETPASSRRKPLVLAWR